MADGPEIETEGQGDSTSTETTESTPDVTTAGQSTEKGDRTSTVEAPEATFFDPRDLEGKPELQAAYKQMQGAFTRRMQELSKNKQKIDAYDAFSTDPVGQMQRMAEQYGYKLTKAEAARALENRGDQDWQPQTWDEVLKRSEERAVEKVRSEFGPYLNQVQELRKTNLEMFLDNNAPDWRIYEDKMLETLQKHPSMVNDPIGLYRLAIPSEVLESRATQAAIKKMQSKVQSSHVSGSSTTTRQPATGIPDKPLTFDEAVRFAKKKLEEDGIREP